MNYIVKQNFGTSLNEDDFYRISMCVGEYELIVYKFEEDIKNEYDYILTHIKHKDKFFEHYIPDISKMSDEELFQQSLIWNEPIDIFLLHEIQKHYTMDYPTFPAGKDEWVETFGSTV